jgi:hypothetical protein
VIGGFVPKTFEEWWIEFGEKYEYTLSKAGARMVWDFRDAEIAAQQQKNTAMVDAPRTMDDHTETERITIVEASRRLFNQASSLNRLQLNMARDIETAKRESAAAMEAHDAEVLKNFISEFGIGLHMVCPDELKKHDAELREKVIEEIAAKINFLSAAIVKERAEVKK